MAMPDLHCAARGLLILMLVALGSTSRAQTDPLSVGSVLSITRLASQQQAATQAATIVAGEATTDSDGFPLSAAVGSGSGPVGGGVIPTSSAAPKTDSFGTALGYCAWDNGTSTGTAGRLAGANDVSKPVLAIVAPGLDGVFQTSCSDIWSSGSAKGDDYIVVISTWQIRQGIGGTLYFGNPVADSSALSALAASGLKDGEIILTKSDNRLWRWSSSSTTWSPVTPAGFTLAPNGTDVLANGRLGIGTSANPAYPFQVVTATGIPIGIQSGSLAGTALINASGTQVGFQGFDVAANRMLLDVQSAGATFALRIGGTDRLTVDATGNLTVSGTINSIGGYQVGGTTVIDSTRNMTAATVNAASGYQVGGTTVIDSGRNATFATLNVKTNGNSVFSVDGTGNVTAAGTVTAPTFVGNLTGNATTASALQSARTLAMTGDGSWSVAFDGRSNVSGVMTLTATGVTAGTYGTATAVPVLTVDAKGRLTSATTIALTPAWSAIAGIPSAITAYAVNLNQNLRTTDSPTFQAVQANGRITANEYIQINGTATENSSCSPNGQVAQNGGGLLLSCQSGMWRKMPGVQVNGALPGAGCSVPNQIGEYAGVAQVCWAGTWVPSSPSGALCGAADWSTAYGWRPFVACMGVTLPACPPGYSLAPTNANGVINVGAGFFAAYNASCVRS